MTDLDPAIRNLLDELVPADIEQRTWRQLLERAEQGHKGLHPRSLLTGRRLLVTAVVLLLIVIVPLTALAVGRGWWFLSAYAPRPVGKVVVVTSGSWEGKLWSLTAFRADTGAICYALTVSPSAPQPVGSAEACGTITPDVPISFLRSLGTIHRAQPGHFPAYIVGATATSVARVTITGAATEQVVRTIAAPTALHAPVRFFLAQRLPDERVTSIAGSDQNGSPIARIRVIGPPSRYKLANPGTPLPLTHAAIHLLRLRHRSPHIYLIASRQGENFYRLGTNGRCYGTGRSDHLSWHPPTNVLRIVGIIECGGHGGSLDLGEPVLDLSTYGRNRGQKLMTVYALAGIASSAIDTVDLVDADGVAVQRVPVRHGVFTAKPLPHGIVAIAPANAAGVWLTSCGFGKNSLPILFMRC